MSESTVVEIWEYQEFDRNNGWHSDRVNPWTDRSFAPSRSIDEIALPSPEWFWASNWRIDKKPGMTDESGWEYASNFSRFSISNRKPKIEKSWNDKSRRRLWSRIMRRDIGSHSKTDFVRISPKIQQGLNSIHMSRVRIEEIVKQAPEAAQSEQMKELVDSVKKHIRELLTILDTLEKQDSEATGGGAGAGAGAAGKITPLTATQLAAVKKLRNDVNKEETAIDRALSSSLPSSSSSSKSRTGAPPPLSKAPSSRTATGPSSSSSTSNSNPSSSSGVTGGRAAAGGGAGTFRVGDLVHKGAGWEYLVLVQGTGRHPRRACSWTGPCRSE